MCYSQYTLHTEILTTKRQQQQKMTKHVHAKESHYSEIHSLNLHD